MATAPGQIPSPTVFPIPSSDPKSPIQNTVLSSSKIPRSYPENPSPSSPPPLPQPFRSSAATVRSQVSFPLQASSDPFLSASSQPYSLPDPLSLVAPGPPPQEIGEIRTVSGSTAPLPPLDPVLDPASRSVFRSSSGRSPVIRQPPSSDSASAPPSLLSGAASPSDPAPLLAASPVICSTAGQLPFLQRSSSSETSKDAAFAAVSASSTLASISVTAGVYPPAIGSDSVISAINTTSATPSQQKLPLQQLQLQPNRAQVHSEPSQVCPHPHTPAILPTPVRPQASSLPQPTYAQAARATRGPGFIRNHANAVESFACIPNTGLTLAVAPVKASPPFRL